jgi:hypothetical protein
MNFASGHNLADLLALLAQRVRSKLLITNASPRSAIAFLLRRVTIVSFIPLRFIFGMRITKPAGS